MKSIITITLFAVLATHAVADRILVFSKTAGYRHPSIEAGVEAIRKLGEENGFEVVHTEDAAIMNDAELQQFSGIVFLSTSGDILDGEQQIAFQRFIQAGGGFVGIHAATDTEKDGWPWFTRFVGAQFSHHPHNQKAVQRKTDAVHPATDFLPDAWERFDEWYSFTNISPFITPLLMLDESTYEGGQNGDFHPSAWYQEFDGGRMFYTAGGHTVESFSEPDFMRHILGGIRYACLGIKPDYAQALPGDDYFEVEKLVDGLRDPVALQVLPDERILILEREGAIRLYDASVGTPVKIHQLDTASGGEQGGFAITIDPDFTRNGYVYVYYSRMDRGSYNRLSRLTLDGYRLVDERTVLEVPTDRSSHQGSTLAFGNDRLLFLSVGDDTNPHVSDGYAPIDEREGHITGDAQRSAGNSADLRGSILRFIMNEDGTYTIPEGNLFPVGMERTRPEIYIKGCRNPYRMVVDKKTDRIHWGDVGPDAHADSERGTRGYDEYNIADKAGYYGWPYRVGAAYYHDYNFATKEVGASFANGITNDSPRNTGLPTLPPPTDPVVWYPYAASERFPELGQGSRTAMAGPVMYQEGLEYSFPPYFDGIPIFYDWTRARFFLLRLTPDNRCYAIHPFLVNQKMINPIFLQLGTKGDLYILQYGSAWYNNTDGTLFRVRYGGENRKPVAVITADITEGSIPLRVNFSSAGTVDRDGDVLRYYWNFGNGTESIEAHPVCVYTNPGIYQVSLRVEDGKGKTNTAFLKVIAGNERPTLELRAVSESRIFDWGSSIAYEVTGHDREDGDLGSDDIEVVAEYRPDGKVPGGKANQSSEQGADPRVAGMNLLHPGVALIQQSSCLACHQSQSQSIGPAYMEVALKYRNTSENRAYLVDKIQKGGAGIYGHVAMPPHAHVKEEQIKEMVAAILEMSGDAETVTRSRSGKVDTIARPANPNNERGIYVLRARYTDKGASGVPPLSAESDPVTLKAPIIIDQKNATVDAKLATIHGGGAHLNHLGVDNYNDINTTLSWTVDVSESGTYSVAIRQGIADAQAGAEYEISLAGSVLSGTVVGTGERHKPVTILVGEVRIENAGRYDLIFRPLRAPTNQVATIQSFEIKRIEPMTSGIE